MTYSPSNIPKQVLEIEVEVLREKQGHTSLRVLMCAFVSNMEIFRAAEEVNFVRNYACVDCTTAFV